MARFILVASSLLALSGCSGSGSDSKGGEGSGERAGANSIADIKGNWMAEGSQNDPIILRFEDQYAEFIGSTSTRAEMSLSGKELERSTFLRFPLKLESSVISISSGDRVVYTMRVLSSSQTSLVLKLIKGAADYKPLKFTRYSEQNYLDYKASQLQKERKLKFVVTTDQGSQAVSDKDLYESNIEQEAALSLKCNYLPKQGEAYFYLQSTNCVEGCKDVPLANSFSVVVRDLKFNFSRDSEDLSQAKIEASLLQGNSVRGLSSCNQKLSRKGDFLSLDLSCAAEETQEDSKALAKASVELKLECRPGTPRP